MAESETVFQNLSIQPKMRLNMVLIMPLIGYVLVLPAKIHLPVSQFKEMALGHGIVQYQENIKEFFFK